MMMSLLTDNKIYKRSFEWGGYEARNFPPNFKRPKVDAIRQFPRNCGALAHQVSETCNGGGTCVESATGILKLGIQSDSLLPVKPSLTLVPNELKLEAAKPLVSHGEVPLKNVKIGSPIAQEKVELEKVGANDTTDKQIDTLGGSKPSFQIRLLPRKYPPPKIRKGVTVFRDFPQGCGRLNHVLSSKVEVLPNGKSAMEQKPLVEMMQTDNIQIRVWCHDDASVFARKVEGKLVKDIDEQIKAETGNDTDVGKDKLFQEAIPSKSELKQEADIEKIGITPSSSSNLLQSNLKCQTACNNDVRAKSQVGGMGNDSEKYIRYKLADDKTGMQQGEKVSDCASTEATGGCKDQKYEFSGANGFKYLTMKQDKTNASKHNFAKEESFVVGAEAGKKDMDTVSNDGGKHGDNLAANESNDLSTVPFDSYQESLSRNKVRETLNLYGEILEKRMQEERKAKAKTKGKVSSYVYVETAMLLKEKKMWIHMNERVLGAVPGVEVGDQFYYRAELVVIGLHHQFTAGIDYMEKDGKKIATSIVASGRYLNDAEFTDVLNYSGEGGNPAIADKKPKDQTLVRGNLALKNSMDEGTPVRVIRGRRTSKAHKSGDKKREKEATFTYDGLYIVSKCWQDRSQHGKLVYMFQLIRIQGQPKLITDMPSRLGNSKACHGRTLVDDISYGKEKIPIRVVNGIDNVKPPSFIYMTNMVYPQFEDSSMLSGCNCVDGCLDYVKCSCVLKNRGTIPFNENVAIFRRKPIVYECGPSCKCPPSCKNRISQHGLRFQLEVFKTGSRGWGVRSRNFISSGSFICEYVGELLNYRQAEERSSNDEYLFDIGIREDESHVGRNLRQTSIVDDGFAIDAWHFGNVGRFINHSCSPNLYAQNVLFDHDDKTMPHVMLFAMKNIPPLQELTYHYSYKIDQVHDAHGNVRRKTCFCGAPNCIGRMY